MSPIRRAYARVLMLYVTVLGVVRHRVRRAREVWSERPDGGYTNETVVITALLVAAAVVVVTIIVGKVTAKANSIDLGP